MSEFAFGPYLDERRRLVEAALDRALPEDSGLLRDLVQAMRYSLFADGKRLRPILCLAGAEAVGGSIEAAMPAAVALEMIHTYSLIHDDLPGMDDDDLRRGKPSNHKMFGVGMAILAGDGLLTLALGHLARSGLANGVERTVRALDLIAEAAGFRGMVGGQAVDLASENKAVGEDVVRFIHQSKTAALITASVVSGAVLGGGDSSRIQALETYGRCTGLAFQIIDDILDIEGETEVIGKPKGSDQARGKATYPSVFGLETSRNAAGGLLADAEKALNGFGPEAGPLRAIAGYLLTRKK